MKLTPDFDTLCSVWHTLGFVEKYFLSIHTKVLLTTKVNDILVYILFGKFAPKHETTNGNSFIRDFNRKQNF